MNHSMYGAGDRRVAAAAVLAPPALALVLVFVQLAAVAGRPWPGAVVAAQAAQAGPPYVVMLPLVPQRIPLGPLATCADVETAWGTDWPLAIAALRYLIAVEQTCETGPLPNKLYAAYYSYGASLEAAGDLAGATHNYLGAYETDPFRPEAREALLRLGALPACLPTPYTPLTSAYVSNATTQSYLAVDGSRLTLDGQAFVVKGVNYYPRSAPWYRFLPESDPAVMAQELDVIDQAGINTLRIFLWYEALFTCAPENPVPLAAGFAKVDTLLALANARGLKVIVTLNDLPDLTYRPLYTDWARYDTQTAFIVQRYMDEPAILAWDLRNEGDIDYGAYGRPVRFPPEQVLGWLAHASALVQGIDPNHLVTAGWLGDPTPTGPSVDFLAFHHWWHSSEMVTRIADYRTRSSQPLLLEEFGYTTLSTTTPDPEASQAYYLGIMANKAQEQGLAGWVVWTAYDFWPPPGQPTNYQNFFGIWRTDLSPKPAVGQLPLP